MGISQMYSIFQLLKTSLNNWSIYTTVSMNFLRKHLGETLFASFLEKDIYLFPQISNFSLHFKLSSLIFRFYMLLRNKAKNERCFGRDNYLVPPNHMLSFVVFCSLVWQRSEVAIIFAVFRSIMIVNSKTQLETLNELLRLLKHTQVTAISLRMYTEATKHLFQSVTHQKTPTLSKSSTRANSIAYH